MRAALPVMVGCLTLAGCVTVRPPPASGMPWAARESQLQQSSAWQLDGRAAVAVGTQGWQASLTWRQSGAAADLHLAGPLGVGAMELRQTPDGLSLNGGPPSDTVAGQVEDKLGFALPLAALRFWLIGVPDPASPSELERNAQDRAQQLRQSGWSVVYERYMPAGGDSLPALLVLSREGVRVRIVVDHWEPSP